MEYKNKLEVVKSLRNVKVVLGNGFDIHCGLKSSYNDFFLANASLYKSIHKWITNLINNQYIFHIKDLNRDYMYFNFGLMEQVTIWDVYFYYCIKGSNPIYSIDDFIVNCPTLFWCDIEEMMKNSFSINVKNKTIENKQINCWSNIFLVLNGKHYYDNLNETEKVCYIFYQLRAKGKQFYLFLLDELRKFENRFVLYLSNAMNNSSYRINFYNSLNQLVNYKEYDNYTIDTFNFTGVNVYDKVKILNINGDLNSPIFGVDNTDDENGIIFTKTYRRMELNARSETVPYYKNFENIIIYGHSLNEQDYNYFFPLFDQINVYDSMCSSKIVFAYSLYKDTKEANEEIIRNYNLKIIKLFEAYETSKGKTSDKRLLDVLYNKGLIIIMKIEPLSLN